MSVSVCLWVCVFVCEYLIRQDILPDLVCMLFVAVAWSSSGGAVLRCVLLLLWMTSCYPIIGPQPQQRRCNVLSGLTTPDA